MKICKDALDDNDTEGEHIYLCVEKVMRMPSLLKDIQQGILAYAEYQEKVKNKHNLIHLFNFITDELTHPF